MNVKVSTLVPMSESDKQWLCEYLAGIEDMSAATHWRILYWANECGSSTEIQPYGVDMQNVEGFCMGVCDNVDYWKSEIQEHGFPRYHFE